MKMEYIESTKKEKITLVVFYTAVVALYFSNEFYIVPLASYIRELPYCESITWVRGEVIYISIYAVLFMALSFYYAYAYLRWKQIPLPNAYVFRKTKIKYGKRAVYEACAAIFVGVLILAGLIFLFYKLNIPQIFSKEMYKSCG